MNLGQALLLSTASAACFAASLGIVMVVGHFLLLVTGLSTSSMIGQAILIVGALVGLGLAAQTALIPHTRRLKALPEKVREGFERRWYQSSVALLAAVAPFLFLSKYERQFWIVRLVVAAALAFWVLMCRNTARKETEAFSKALGGDI
jgi:Na+/melibiose symporter-like transporter